MQNQNAVFLGKFRVNSKELVVCLFVVNIKKRKKKKTEKKKNPPF